MPDEVRVGPGVIIGNGYKLEKKLGESSLGDIYTATQESSGQKVHVEVLSGEMRQDEERVNRLLQEIELVAALQHPNIVQAIEAGQDSETYFLVTAYEASKTLEEVLEGHKALPEADAVKYTANIASALKHAWDEKRILHRDVKPANIQITEAGAAKLTGFGIAKSSQQQSLGLTGAGFTIGTPEYMSPEQIRASDDLNFASDMYALGIVFYEMATGRIPFEEAAPILLMQKHMDEDPEPANERNPEVSAGCAEVIQTMLAKDPADRYDSWQTLIDTLNAVANGTYQPTGGAAASKAAPAAAAEPTAPTPTSTPTAAAASEKKGKFGCGGLLILGFAVLGAGTGLAAWLT